jgi:hypothetical protein
MLLFQIPAPLKTSNDGEFNCKSKAATVTANNKSKTYGDDNSFFSMQQ